MKVLQLLPTYNKPCGVAMFSHNLESYLKEIQVDVTTSKEWLNSSDYDLCLIHFIKPWYGEHLIKFQKTNSKPLIVFLHEIRNKKHWPNAIANGYMAMEKKVLGECDEMKMVFPHPVFFRTIKDREKLKSKFGTSGKFVIGSNGFINKKRRFVEIVKNILSNTNQNVFVDLLATRHHEWSHNDIEKELINMQSERFRCDFSPMKHEELNERLQACDLLWCWTDREGSYGSGVASDHFGSGTRMVVPKLLQHKHVFVNDNVVVTPHNLKDFCETLVKESNKTPTRHDPSELSWQKTVPSIKKFFEKVSNKIKI